MPKWTPEELAEMAAFDQMVDSEELTKDEIDRQIMDDYIADGLLGMKPGPNRPENYHERQKEYNRAYNRLRFRRIYREEKSKQ